ncbi:DUF2550 family protein [Corynebacterium uterequi]|uniref:Putative DUF2550 family protein n=1 Tax=Corynebacterium uterequi TaxID=1072256 RepID=A0A0G3HID5_9CORY|nr:DUF2550 family protein [Corynebacterium uterequi]AKK10902.1 putative DUF2550 family protein [Corynebacterium uterequi]
MRFAIVLVVGLVLVAVALAAWRFLIVRSQGTGGLFRTSSTGVWGTWHYALLRYSGDELLIYRLTSLLPAADIVLHRTFLSIKSHRRPQSGELDVIDPDTVLITIEHGQRQYEFALEHHAAKAIIAWVESAPSERQERRDHRALLMKARRQRGR